jgi:hypothetical protein
MQNTESIDIKLTLCELNMKHPVWIATYIPKEKEEWFLNRNENGEVKYKRWATEAVRSGRTKEEAIRKLNRWVEAAQQNKRFTVEIINKKSKKIQLETCGCDEKDVIDFFEKKKSVVKVVSAKLK